MYSSVHKIIICKIYGCTCARFTHSKNGILTGATRIDSNIRYQSIYDNAYITQFKGHKDRFVNK